MFVVPDVSLSGSYRIPIVAYMHMYVYVCVYYMYIYNVCGFNCLFTLLVYLNCLHYAEICKCTVCAYAMNVSKRVYNVNYIVYVHACEYVYITCVCTVYVCVMKTTQQLYTK